MFKTTNRNILLLEQVTMGAILKLDWVDVSWFLAFYDVLSPLPLHAARAISIAVLKLLWLTVTWPIVVITNLQTCMTVSTG